MEVDDEVNTSSETASLSSDENEQGSIESFTAGMNCPEKIVFVLDTCVEMGETYYQEGSKNARSNLMWAKKGIEMFLHTKSSLNANHEYSVLLLQQDDIPFLYQESTSDIKLILDCLRDVKCWDGNSKELLLDPILKEINSNCKITDGVLRAVFIYARAGCHLKVSEEGRNMWDSLRRSGFVFDSLSFSRDEEQTNRNLQWLCDMDKMKQDYVLQASVNVAEIFECFAKLVSHPLQRSKQEKAFYEFPVELKL